MDTHTSSARVLPPQEPSTSPVMGHLLAFTAVTFFGYLAVGLPLPVIPVHVHDVLGYGPVVVGCAIGAQSIATLLTRQMAGAQCDTRGAKFATLWGLGLSGSAGLFYLASAMLVAQPAVSLVALLAGRVVLGVGESLLITGILAWAIARVGPQNSGKVMVWIGIAMYGAIAIGAPLGSALAGAFGFTTVAAAVTILPLIGMVSAARLKPVAIVASARLGFWRIVGKIFGLGSGLVFATFGFGALATFVALYFASRGWAGGSLALTAFGVGYVGSRLLFGGLPDRFGGAAMAAASLAVEGLGQLLIWFAPSPEIALAGALLTGIGYSLCFPALGVEVVRRVPPASRGSAMGAYVAFFDIGIGAAGPITGVVVSAFGYPSAFLTGGLAGIAGACFVAMIAASNRRTA